MLGSNLRTVCQSFTADGTYDLRLDFFDEAGIPNRPRGTCISLVALRPPRQGADAGGSDAGGAAARAPAAVPAEAASEKPRAPFNPLGLDENGDYVGQPAQPRVALQPITTTAQSVTVGASAASPSPATSSAAGKPSTPTAATTHAAPAKPAAAGAGSGTPSTPSNFTYTSTEVGSFGPAQFALSTVANIADTLSYILPSKRKARGGVSSDGLASTAAETARLEGAVPSRVLTSKELAAHPHKAHPLPWSSAPENVYMVFNVNTSLLLVDYSGVHRGPLQKLTFPRSRPLVHDVNLLTRSPERLDIAVGMSNGEVLVYDPFGKRSLRLNKQGVMTKAAVTAIRWVPGSEGRILASYTDGCMLLLDTEREDAPLSLEVNTTDMFIVTTPKSEKHNPVACWQVGRAGITAFAFSPDCQHLATTGRDGFLRIFHFPSAQLLVSMRSYFGGLTCVAWSPDGKYLATGGEDDLVSVWSFTEQRLVARCQGHQSWVASVAFDAWKCDASVYRLGSVGEDARLALWDFSVHALHRPRSNSISRHRSVSSISGARSAPAPVDAVGERRGSFQMGRVVPAPGLHEAPTIEPLMIKKIHSEPLSHLLFREDAIVTACRRGQVKVWVRPASSTGSGSSAPTTTTTTTDDAAAASS